MVTKNGNGEIADLVSVSQFEPNETQSACGPFAVALCKYAGAPGKSARGSAEDVDTYADNVYDRIFSNHDISTEAGVVPDQIQTMILQAGLHYQDLTGIADGSAQADDIKAIKAALDQGYLVIGEIAETSVIDQEFGGSPYYWNGAGLWHYVVYSGYTDSALLTHDGANINGTLNGSNQPRPQPRHYDASQIQNRWATIVWTDWLPMMPVGFDPTQTTINGGASMNIPAGWHDDGTTLTAPNGVQVVHGFRDYVLSHSWDSANIPLEVEHSRAPLEDSNPTLGQGTCQTFRTTLLEYTHDKGVFVAWVGQELMKVRAELAVQQANASAQEVLALKTKLKSINQLSAV